MTLYVECNADTVLAVAVGVARRDIKHANGRGGVCNFLEKTVRGKGLVDQDPFSAPAPYLSGLQVEQEICGFRVLTDTKRGHTIIMLMPRLEEWVLMVAKSDKIELVKHGLSDDAHKFREEVNLRPQKLFKLVEAERDRSEHLRALYRILRT